MKEKPVDWKKWDGSFYVTVFPLEGGGWQLAPTAFTSPAKAEQYATTRKETCLLMKVQHPLPKRMPYRPKQAKRAK